MGLEQATDQLKAYKPAGDRREDGELYQLACRGNEEALETLIGRYRTPLSHFISTILMDSRDREEVVLDSFAALIARGGRFGGKSTLKTFLFAIARHQAFKRQRTLREVPVEGAVLEHLYKEITPEELPEDQLEAAALRECLHLLHQDYREALYLVYLQGMNYKDAARVMGKREDQISHLVYNGKKALRKLLEDDKPRGRTR